MEQKRMMMKMKMMMIRMVMLMQIKILMLVIPLYSERMGSTVLVYLHVLVV